MANFWRFAASWAAGFGAFYPLNMAALVHVGRLLPCLPLQVSDDCSMGYSGTVTGCLGTSVCMSSILSISLCGLLGACAAYLVYCRLRPEPQKPRFWRFALSWAAGLGVLFVALTSVQSAVAFAAPSLIGMWTAYAILAPCCLLGAYAAYLARPRRVYDLGLPD